MNRATAISIIKDVAPDMIISGDENLPHINVQLTKDNPRVHSIMIPSDMTGTLEVTDEQQYDSIVWGLQEARRILPRR